MPDAALADERQSLTRTALEEIRARAAAATPGAWAWTGNMPPHGCVRLVANVSGTPIVMDFQRLGTSRAQPVFADGRDMDDPGWGGAGYMRPAAEYMKPAFDLATTDGRCHRPLLTIENPDAKFIAGARGDVDALLAHIAQLERLALDAVNRAEIHDEVGAQDLRARLIGWHGAAAEGVPTGG